MSNKTRKVLQFDARNDVISEIEVADNYYECSHCGQWHPEESFYSEMKAKMMKESYGMKEVTRTRTNCETCFQAPAETWDAVKDASFKMRSDYKKGLRDKDLKTAIELKSNTRDFMENSISVKELKAMIADLEDDERIVVETTDDDGYGEDEWAPEVSVAKEKYGITYRILQPNY
jgi:hypothetical protein